MVIKKEVKKCPNLKKTKIIISGNEFVYMAEEELSPCIQEKCTAWNNSIKKCMFYAMR